MFVVGGFVSILSITKMIEADRLQSLVSEDLKHLYKFHLGWDFFLGHSDFVLG